MYPLNELNRVEETKDLMPNLPIFAKALFGANSYLLKCEKGHIDWATNRSKRADGFVWLPWLAQLWIVEVEWKEGSNFFDQSRAFAKSKIDWEKLSDELCKCLCDIEPILNKSAQGIKEGHLVNQIISQTKQNHYRNGYLLPHCWVVLGHDKDNQDKLKNDYEEEIKSRFKDNQQYILTMTRMFQSNTSTYALLTQYYSKRCMELIRIEKSILVPSITNKQTESISFATSEPRAICDSLSVITTESPQKGRASQVFRFLKDQRTHLEHDVVRLRIQLDQNHFHDFEISWEHTGKEIMVLSKQGISKRPSDAAKEIFGRAIPSKCSNIARKYGSFIDVSGNQYLLIARYADVEKHISQMKKAGVIFNPIENNSVSNKSGNFFDSINPHRQKKIRDNILHRRKLWEAFLKNKKMSSFDFKNNHEFKPKAVAGFMLFLTKNKIATRFADTFTLNEEVIPYIKELLNKS